MSVIPSPPGDDATDPTRANRECERCRALSARIAELERALAATQDPGSTAGTIPPLELKALRLLPHGWGEGWALRPSPAKRNWMNELTHAYHCLPMVIANQWGWQILCPTDVVVTWDGSTALEGLSIEVAPQYASAIKSQFGSGIVTFSPPWLFRTSPGWDLYLKGPSNRWKPNCAPLEGVIETWWLNYTFTINWKIVEPGTVFFARGESLGQLVPTLHATFEGAKALEAPIGLVEPEAAQELLRWLETRRRLQGQADNVHRLYRRAEGIEEHLQRVRVPEVAPIDAWTPSPPAEG